MKNYSTIIWDFNGTLIDDADAALGAVNDMLRKRNQPLIDFYRYSESVDTPIWKFYERVFIPGTITPDEAIAEFDAGYEKHLSENPIMQGTEEILTHFSKLRKCQLVVSASHVDKVRARLKDLGLADYFDTVLAHSDYYAGDKTYLAQQYLAENGIDPQEVVVIGDCVSDYRMAEQLHCDCILNTCGHQCRRELEITGAALIDSLSELKDIIQ